LKLGALYGSTLLIKTAIGLGLKYTTKYKITNVYIKKSSAHDHSSIKNINGKILQIFFFK